MLIAAVLGSAVYLLREPLIGLYTSDPVIIAAALPLLAWVVLFHVADAAQTIAAFVLRAHRIATVPLVIYVVAIWVIGLGGGYVAVFDARRRARLAARRPGLLVDGDARRGARRRRPRRLPRLDAAPRARRGGRRSGAAGSVIRKQVPPPSRASQRTLPPWRSAICLTSDRPRPTPPACSAWPGRRKNGSKIRSRISAGTPAPRSQTWIVASPPLAAGGRSTTVISPPP